MAVHAVVHPHHLPDDDMKLKRTQKESSRFSEERRGSVAGKPWLLPLEQEVNKCLPRKILDEIQ